MQTRATVWLDQREIGYEVHPYEQDPTAASFGLDAAEALGLDPAVVFKTLVVRLGPAPHALAVAIVAVTDQLNLKALAHEAGAKRASMSTVSDAERSTGYVAGGISPFGQTKQLPTFIDESATTCDQIWVSAGQRGLELSLSPNDLIRSLDARVAALATST